MNQERWCDMCENKLLVILLYSLGIITKYNNNYDM